MAIPTSGELSARTINVELGRSSTAQLSIDAVENGSYGAINQSSRDRPNSSNPAAYSEWRGYDHNIGGVTLVPLPEVGYAGRTGQEDFRRDDACINSVTRPGRYWGSDERLEFSAGLDQFWADAAGTIRPPAGWYAQFAEVAVYWNGSTGTELESCRI
jgi:hypothetical protein